MEISNLELNKVKEAEEQSQADNLIAELRSLELALVGGGIGDVVF